MHPAKAVGWNEVPFGMDTCVVTSNVVLDRDCGLHGKGRFGCQNPQSKFVLQIAPKPFEIAEWLPM